MSELLVYRYRIPIKNVKLKRIYQFSDTHLALWDEFSTKEEKERAIARTADWDKGRFSFAKSFGEPCGEAQSMPASTFFLELLEASKKADALIMAGDIVDFHTDGNVRFLADAFQNYPIPYMPLCGNHDEPEKLPADHPYKPAENAVQKIDLGDMVILGYDDSKRIITQDQIDILKDTLLGGKPILIAMHIPIMTECGDDYYYLNYDGCPDENREFVELIQKNAEKIIAVTCGHLHGNKVCDLCPGLTQYVSSQGLIGSLSVYEIGEYNRRNMI